MAQNNSDRNTSSHTWPGWLLIILIGVSGAGWFLLLFFDLGNTEPTGWLPSWPWWVILGLGILYLTGAWGFYHFFSWGWIFAVLYVFLGLLSLASQLLALISTRDGFLFLLPAIGVISLPYLFRRRSDFFSSRPR